eukprot:scaffold19798_cov51-Attheya_sp.AAC.4
MLPAGSGCQDDIFKNTIEEGTTTEESTPDEKGNSAMDFVSLDDLLNFMDGINLTWKPHDDRMGDPAPFWCHSGAYYASSIRWKRLKYSSAPSGTQRNLLHHARPSQSRKTLWRSWKPRSDAESIVPFCAQMTQSKHTSMYRNGRLTDATG